MSSASFELPNTEEVVIDGYRIDLSGGALGGQALVYDAGSNTFIAADAYGTVSGSFAAQQVAYSNGTFSLTGSSNFVFDDAYNVLSVFGDGYVSQRMIINGSTAVVSASGTGAFRFNLGTNHLEFSENGGSWSQLGAGSVSSVSNSDSTLTVLPTTGAVVASLNLGHANTWSAKQTFSSHIAVDGYTLDLSGGVSSGQILAFNGTSFVASSAGSGTLSGTLTNTKVPYATGSSTLADSGMAWDNTNKILTITTLTGNDGLSVTDGTRTMGLFITSTAGQLGTTTNQSLQFFTNNQAAQMTLNTSGNLGIGVSPSYKLDVNGDIHISANRLLIDASSASVSPSGMGAIRFNTGNSHLEFSENGSSWTAFGTSVSSGEVIFFDIIKYATATASLSIGSGNENGGIIFRVTQDATCTGIKFYWADPSSLTIRCSLWNMDSNTLITSVDVAVSATGIYIGTFASSQPLTAFTKYAVTQWETTGTSYTKFNDTLSLQGFLFTTMAAEHLIISAINAWTTGNGPPTNVATSEKYPTVPIYTVP